MKAMASIASIYIIVNGGFIAPATANGCASAKTLASMSDIFYNYLNISGGLNRIRNTIKPEIQMDTVKPQALPPPIKQNGFWTTVPFVFATDASVDQYKPGKKPPPPRTGQIFGIDISGYDATLPYDKLKSSLVNFVIIKASEGIDCEDPGFASHWNGMKSLKGADFIPFSAYHFLSSSVGDAGTAQADQFVADVNAAGGFDIGGLRPAVDLEWDYQGGKVDLWSKRSKQEIVTEVHDFITDVHQRTGWTPMIYTNTTFLKGHGIISKTDIDALRGGAPIWNFDLLAKDLAEQKPAEDVALAPVLWQFNWQMQLHIDGGPNYSGGDVNLFTGTPAQFKSMLATKN